MTREWERRLWALAVVAAVALSAFHLVWGDLNQDEGWYLYAAGRVWRGAAPYRDFAFTQGPMMPVAYAALTPLVEQGGLLAGRAATACLGFLAAFAAAGLARRLAGGGDAGRAAGFAAFCLIAINPYQAYFMAVVKTYALCGLFLALGFYALARTTGRGGLWKAALAGALLAAAAATRLSAAAAVAAAVAVLFWKRRECGGAWAACLAGACVAGAVLVLPFCLMAPVGFRFGLLEYHVGRSAGGLVKSLMLKAGFVSRVTLAYFPALALGAAAWFAGREARRAAPPSAGPGAAANAAGAAAWLAVAWMTLIHLATPFPYDDYQAPVYPLAAAGVAVLAAGLPGWRLWLRPGVLVLTLLAALGSPLNQEWMVRGRDRIWWRMKEKPPLLVLREAAAEVRRLAPAGGELLTQDTYLAVEAGMLVPAGLELGPFSLFPAYTDEQARARRVVNTAMLRDLLRSSPAPVAAFSGYGLAIRAPEVEELAEADRAALWDEVRARYRPAGEIPYFGQAGTRLTIWTRTPAGE